MTGRKNNVSEEGRQKQRETLKRVTEQYGDKRKQKQLEWMKEHHDEVSARAKKNLAPKRHLGPEAMSRYRKEDPKYNENQRKVFNNLKADKDFEEKRLKAIKAWHASMTPEQKRARAKYCGQLHKDVNAAIERAERLGVKIHKQVISREKLNKTNQFLDVLEQKLAAKSK